MVAVLARPSIHPVLMAFAFACFIGTLLADLAYWGSMRMLWSDFASWLISAGSVIGLIALIVAGIEYLTVRQRRAFAPLAFYVGGIVTLILAVFDMLIHTHDAWTSVVPWGLVLSAVTVVVALISLWAAWWTDELRVAEVTR